MNPSFLSPNDAAPQHGPRPLPLFLAMLREETAASSDRRAKALAGLRAYQSAERFENKRLGEPVHRSGRASLIDYGGSGQAVVFVPSLINPPFILDMPGERSLLRWLTERGHHCMLVDWGTPDPSDRGDSIDEHVTKLLLPMIEALDEPPVLVGYCLGGTMVMAAAMLRRVSAVATIAAPWNFAGYGKTGRARIAAQWEASRPACEQLGLVPTEVLQTGFWRMDPARTIDKYIRFAATEPDSDAARSFVALEDWANAGAPLTLAAGRQLFERFIGADDPGEGRWQIGAVPVDPAALTCPAVEFVSSSDRIVPAASAARLPDSRMLSAGHVGMIVGGRRREQLWHALDGWLSAVSAPK